MPSIELKNIYKKYNNVDVLNNINYKFYSSNVYLITGKTGNGKSTLLSIITNDNKYEGQVIYDNVRKEDFSITSKNNLINSLNGIDSLRCVSSDEVKINYIINKLKIESIIDKKISTYSNGEYQRLSFAIIYLMDKPIWLLDEPTGCLDVDNKKIIYDLIEEIKDNKIIIIVSHDCEDERFIHLEVSENKLIEHKNNIINNENIKNNNYKFIYHSNVWFKVFLSIFKKNYIKYFLSLLILIIVSFASIIFVSLKDNRDDVLQSIKSRQLIPTTNIDEADYFTFMDWYNGQGISNVIFSPDNKFSFDGETYELNTDFGEFKSYKLINSNYVKDYYSNNLLYIPAQNMFDLLSDTGASQFVDNKNPKDLLFHEVEIDAYNLDIDINYYIGKDIFSNVAYNNGTNFTIKRMNNINDASTTRKFVIHFSKEYVKYIKDNYIEINQKVNSTCYFNTEKINKDNMYSYKVISEQSYNKEYKSYQLYALSIKINICLIIVYCLSFIMLNIGLNKSFMHNKIILKSYGCRYIYLSSYYYIFYLISLVPTLISYMIYNNNKLKINDFVFNNYNQILVTNFNYVILISLIICLVISIIYSFTKKSIFKIEKIS